MKPFYTIVGLTTALCLMSTAGCVGPAETTTDDENVGEAQEASANVCNWINQVQTYSYNGTTYSVTTLQLAAWASNQTYRSPKAGYLPIQFFLTQWGWESGWGGYNWSTINNPAMQKSGCGIAVPNGYTASGFAKFNSIRDGVRAYTALLINGYPFVQYASATDSTGFVSLGRGYHPLYSSAVNYCGASGTFNGNPGKRLWDNGQYDDGSGPGSKLKSSYNANACLQQWNVVQKTLYTLPGFADVF